MTGHTCLCFPLAPCCASSQGPALCLYLINGKTQSADDGDTRACEIPSHTALILPGMVLSRMNPKKPPMNMCVVNSTTIIWSSSWIPANTTKQTKSVNRNQNQNVSRSLRNNKVTPRRWRSGFSSAH